MYTKNKGLRCTQNWVLFMTLSLTRCYYKSSGVSDFFFTPGTLARQAPLSMGFFRQEYWSGLPCPPPGDLPSPGIEPVSPVVTTLQANSLPLKHQGSPIKVHIQHQLI